MGKSINERWLENLPRDWKSLTPQQKLEVTKKLVEYRNTVRSGRAGALVEDKWEQYLTREFKYVFKRPVMRSAGTTVEADYIVGNDLKRLRLIESKRTPSRAGARRSARATPRSSGGAATSKRSSRPISWTAKPCASGDSVPTSVRTRSTSCSPQTRPRSRAARRRSTRCSRPRTGIKGRDRRGRTCTCRSTVQRRRTGSRPKPAAS